MKQLWVDICSSYGVDLTEHQAALLGTYRDWLADEAMVAGGIGPREEERLDERHIGDSLFFGAKLPDVAEVWDLGSGVGLPGIPLAVLRPETEFVLLDRAGRRADLMKRAVRILDLENVQVLQGEIAHIPEPVPAIVSRATLPPDVGGKALSALLQPDGIAIVGGSWRERPIYEDWETHDVGSEVLDHPVWLLIMRPR